MGVGARACTHWSANTPSPFPLLAGLRTKAQVWLRVRDQHIRIALGSRRKPFSLGRMEKFERLQLGVSKELNFQERQREEAVLWKRRICGELGNCDGGWKLVVNINQLR
ncbi:hypothetical protein NPIL_78521 [Nephila pilipes]|uniref:Uncharacterized protein n=1 Tax=Nephila pilipes TaxID=299642 RepID=A0A8X6Q6W1_NEPPI|nr:hypothetical protein NPIL_78521 [Nephila pilipes]